MTLGFFYRPSHALGTTLVWTLLAGSCGQRASERGDQAARGTQADGDTAAPEPPEAAPSEPPQGAVEQAQDVEPGGPPVPFAHVTAVSASGGDMSYSLSVTVRSSDVDCSQYADWWEVLSQDGALIYRRILGHSHTEENGTTDADAPGNSFTRSGGPVAVSAAQTLYVRAHTSTGGYRGEVRVGSVAEGFSLAEGLPLDFAANVEDSEPQPDGCSF